MAWQIVTVIAAFIFTGRMLLFVIGLILGGMLTVAIPQVQTLMGTLVEWWAILMTALVG